MFHRCVQQMWFLCLALALGVSAAPGQSIKPGTTRPGQERERFHVTQWTAEDGLPQSRVSALAQTPDGYLWVGTWFGLARFDGVRFVLFNGANTPSLDKDAITALAVDRADGALWIGTPSGIVRMRDRQFTRLRQGTNECVAMRSYISSLTPAAGGGVWARADRAVAFFRNGCVSSTQLELAWGERIQSEWEPAPSKLALATSQRLVSLDTSGNVREESLPSGAPANAWMAGLFTDRSQRTWLGMHGKLLLCSSGTCQELFSLPGRNTPTDRFLEDRAGNLWVACAQSGLWRHSNRDAQWLLLGERGGERSITCLLEDREGFLWVGSDAGLFELRPSLIQGVTREHGLPDENCWSLSEAPDGAIWVETQRGIARVAGNGVQTFQDEPARRPQQSILVDHENRVWMGDGNDGLVAWLPGVSTNRFWTGNVGVTVEALYLDRQQRVWVGTSRGATWFDRTQPAASFGEHGLPTTEIRSLCQTRDGTMWFGTWRSGVFRWKPRPEQHPTRRSGGPGASSTTAANSAEVSRFTSKDGLADDRVFVIHEDSEGALWMGTHNGLSRFKDGRFVTYRTEQGLLDNIVNWLEADESGHLWFSCNRGIFRVSLRELEAVAAGKQPRVNAAVYGAADGMPSPETNGEHAPAGCRGRDGRLWFPTSQGLAILDPQVWQEQRTEYPPLVNLEQVVADGEVLYGDGCTNGASASGDGALRLPPGRARLLKIRYTAHASADPRRLRFQYFLSGGESDWREVTDERVAYYTDVQPGHYAFKVKAANPHGVWTDTPATFEFSLAPYFYQTWPFFGLCGLALLAVAGGVLARRLSVQRRILQLEHQRAMEQERARLARDLHDELGTALTGLALELDVVRRGIDDGSAMNTRLRGIADHSRGLAARMREVVWSISPRCDDVPGLATFLEQHAVAFVQAAGLQCRLDFPENLPALPIVAEVRHQVALGVREALANIVRHARAREVELGLRLENNSVLVRVRDDGAGFDADATLRVGQGLANLRSRIEAVGGTVLCESTPGSGTTVTFRLPLQER